MSPIERIRGGITAGCWAEVCEGFSQLTGERVTVPRGGGAHERTLRLIKEEIERALYPTPEEDSPPDEGGEEEAEPDRPKALPEPPKAKKGDLDFSIEHKPAPRVDGKKNCATLPMDTAPGENLFRDDKTKAKEYLKDSRKHSKEFRGKEHRDPYKPVEAVCAACGKKSLVHPDNAPQAIEGEFTSFFCDRCGPGRGR